MLSHVVLSSLHEKINCCSNICKLFWTPMEAGNHIYHKKHCKNTKSRQSYIFWKVLLLLQTATSHPAFFIGSFLPLISFHPKLYDVTWRAPSFTIFMRRKCNFLAHKHAPLFFTRVIKKSWNLWKKPRVPLNRVVCQAEPTTIHFLLTVNDYISTTRKEKIR